MYYDLFHTAIGAMILANKASRQAMGAIKNEHPPHVWATEFCTVRCDIGRQTGKSRYILSNAKPGDLVVTVNPAMREVIFEHAQCQVATAEEIASISDEPQPCYPTIWVDEPFYVFQKVPPEHLYRTLAVGRDHTFVLLGV